MLIIMKDRYVHQFSEALLDNEAGGRRDILKVNAAKAWAQELHAIDELIDVFAVDLQINRINISKAFEKDGFSFHHRL